MWSEAVVLLADTSSPSVNVGDVTVDPSFSQVVEADVTMVCQKPWAPATTMVVVPRPSHPVGGARHHLNAGGA